MDDFPRDDASTPFVAYFRELLAAHNVSQNALARRLGHSPSYINAILRGRARPPKPPVCAEIARALDAAPAEAAELCALSEAFWAQRLQVSTSAANPPARSSSGQPESVAVSPWPLLTKVLAGAPQEWQDVFQPGHAEEVLPVPFDDPNGFCLEILGDSMTPRYLPGDIIAVAPNRPVHSGDCAVVRVGEGGVDGERTVKHVRILPGDRVELRPANPKYPTVTYHLREVQILGKVVALIRKEG